jgi:hypothetical protein
MIREVIKVEINVEWMLNLDVVLDEPPAIKLGNHDSTVELFVDPDPVPFVVPVVIGDPLVVDVPIVVGGDESLEDFWLVKEGQNVIV